MSNSRQRIILSSVKDETNDYRDKPLSAQAVRRIKQCLESRFSEPITLLTNEHNPADMALTCDRDAVELLRWYVIGCEDALTVEPDSPMDAVHGRS